MDKLRLGRALGYGTRHAARTLAAVADAATAPDPRQASPSREQGPGAPEKVSAVAQPRSAVTQRRVMPGVRPPSTSQLRGAGRSVWGPLATFSGALWLRVTGSFFALIAFAMANGVWRLRSAVRGGVEDASALTHLVLFAAFALLFGYFAVSSFVRARQREQRGSH